MTAPLYGDGICHEKGLSTQTFNSLIDWIPMRLLKQRIIFRRADMVLGKEAHQKLIDCLTGNTLAGDGIPGTGGMCKILIATSGRGKHGGTRVVYSHGGIGMPVFLLMIYPRVARKDLTPRERRFLKSLAAVLGKKGRERK